MRVFKRPKSDDEHIVYDSGSEAVQNGVYPKEYDNRNLYVGDWIQYPDGVVAQVLKINFAKKTRIVFTVLNSYNTKSKPDKVSSEYQSRYSLGKFDIDLKKVDNKKMAFLEAWLFQGCSLEEAVLEHLSRYFYKKRRNESFNAKMFGYFVLSGEWLDEVLKNNRLIRERYMSIIGTLESKGLGLERVADELSKALESQEWKERANALNRLIELHAVEEKKRKGGLVPIGASYSVTREERKILEDRRQKELPESTDFDNILEEARNGTGNRVGSTNEDVGDKEGQELLGGGSEAQGEETVPVGTHSEERLSPAE